MKISEYEKLLDGARCRWHERPKPLPAKIKSYDHDGGYAVDGFDKKQWLYVHCPACGYDWSLWKLGISEVQS